jgi:hypothetical protein
MEDGCIDAIVLYCIGMKLAQGVFTLQNKNILDAMRSTLYSYIVRLPLTPIPLAY